MKVKSKTKILKTICVFSLAALMVATFAGCGDITSEFNSVQTDVSSESSSVTADDIANEINNKLNDYIDPYTEVVPDENISSDEDSSSEEPFDDAVSALYETQVVRVVDGDTFIANVNGTDEYVRLIGVDTPESVHPDEDRNTEAGDEASTHTKEILPVGTTVWLEKDVSDRDQYDRLLRYVWLEYPNNSNNAEEVKTKMLNALLVEDGWATAKSYAPDTKWSGLFSSLI